MTRSSRPRSRRDAPDSERDGPRLEARVAFISAVAIVVSAVLAALISGWTAGGQQKRQEAREDRREQIAVRGAARILFSEFFQTAAQMAVLANDRWLRRFDAAYEIDVQPDDMKLIAASLPGTEWGAVQDALLGVRQLDTFVKTQIERGRTRLTKGEACYALIDLRAIRYASDALSDLAAAPNEPPPVPPLDCKPKPGPVPPVSRWQDL
jgi:hypothetical protein